MSLLDTMPHVVTHKRRRYVNDAVGASVEIDQTLTTGNPVWIQNAGQKETVDYGKKDQTITHRVYFEDNLTLQVGDSLVVTSGPSFVGVILRIGTFTDRSAGLGELLTAMCFEDDG